MKKQINLYKYVAKENAFNGYLIGVYHDGEARMAVASDAHVLVASAGAYDPDKAGQTIGRGGEVITEPDKHYPKWAQCIPARNINAFPMDQLREAVRRAENFRRNLPKKTKEGAPIYRGGDIIFIAVKAEGEAITGERRTFRIGLGYKYAKMLCELPAKGATVTFQDEHRAIFYKNEGEGIIALAMPIMKGYEHSMGEAFRDGLYNSDEEIRWADDPMRGSYIGKTIISALGDSEEARTMFREPEKKETAHFVPCIDRGYAGAKVHKRLDTTLKKIEGTETFFRREGKRYENSDYLYKKDGVYYLFIQTIPSGSPLLSLSKHVRKEGLDGLTYSQIAERMKWDPEKNCVLAAWEKIKGAGVSIAS